MFSLKNKKAIITGAGSGIGKAMAILFAKQGAEVHINEVANANATLDEIISTNGYAYAHLCNVANQQEVIKTFEAINDLVGCQRLYQRKYKMQFYLSGTGAYAFCRWFFTKKLSGK